jgi:alpha-glucoside transport system substrate-binding protein
VTEALTEMGKLLQSDEIAGGTSSALQTDFPTSVTQVFATPPKAAQVLEGDFVGGVITAETQAKPETDFNVFAFPEINDSGPVVMGGGDVMVMFKDNPAARALIEYLATPEAAEIWAAKGGFSSPNKNVDANVYPDPITKKTATDLANAEVFRFDMSDLMPGAFGSDALFTLLQDFLKNPDDVEGIQKKLETAAASAFKSS